MNRVADGRLDGPKLLLIYLERTTGKTGATATIKVTMAPGMVLAVVLRARTTAARRRLVPAIGQDALGTDHREIADLADMTNRDDLNRHVKEPVRSTSDLEQSDEKRGDEHGQKDGAPRDLPAQPSRT
jgi:hypothetical protein